MAKVTITIEDSDKPGDFKFVMASQPEFPKETKELTVAQALGIRLAEHITNLVKDHGKVVGMQIG